jgi:hypothetical protein
MSETPAQGKAKHAPGECRKASIPPALASPGKAMTAMFARPASRFWGVKV